MALETVTGTAPSHWACYFINGDSDSMSEVEERAADQFAAWLGGIPCDCEEAGFIRYHDASQFWPFAADCQTYTALIQTEGVEQ